VPIQASLLGLSGAVVTFGDSRIPTDEVGGLKANTAFAALRTQSKTRGTSNGKASASPRAGMSVAAGYPPMKSVG
jgi:hypothetical protein